MILRIKTSLSKPQIFVKVIMPLNSPVSIVVADGHQIVCEGISILCEAQPQFRVVGQCWDGVAALESIRSLRPDVAILDFNMPGLHGVELIRQIRQAGVSTKLLVLSISRDTHAALDALQSGANGFLLKDGPYSHLLAAIRHTLEGGI